jgi:hypothetical protein
MKKRARYVDVVFSVWLEDLTEIESILLAYSARMNRNIVEPVRVVQQCQ